MTELKNKRIELRASKQDIERLTYISDYLQTSKSNVIRTLIKDYYNATYRP